MAIDMAIDMDIDMDLDIDNYSAQESLPHPSTENSAQITGTSISISGSNSDEAQPVFNKVHLRGLDNFTSSDIKLLASEYFDSQQFEKIEWIDDTSANLVYSTPAIAAAALHSFTDVGISDISQLPPLRMLRAKPIPSHPEARLEVRLAVASDKKRAGARDRSRFYLFNPEHDPAERRKTDGYGRLSMRRYRDRDASSHMGAQKIWDFDASLYDDDDISRAVQATKTFNKRQLKSNLSSREHRGQGIRKSYMNQKARKELFPDRVPQIGSGRLRDQSVSPIRDNVGDQNMDVSQSETTYKSVSHHLNTDMSDLANRQQAQMIKARLKEASVGLKELFPHKTSISHSRSDLPDETVAAADLLASRMTIPFLDGSSDIVPERRDLTSRITETGFDNRISGRGLNIRGAAKRPQSTNITIKGIASASSSSVKELFPSKSGLNSGKELFSVKLEGRGAQRRKAQDMFH